MSARFAVVVSRYNAGVTQKLLAGALDSFRKRGVAARSVEVYWVPGAFELPVVARRLALTKKYSGVVCLGCVLKGGTEHHRYIAHAVSQGLMRVSLDSGVPVAFGVLTPDNWRQARARSGRGSANKGSEAAEAAFETARVLEK